MIAPYGQTSEKEGCPQFAKAEDKNILDKCKVSNDK